MTLRSLFRISAGACIFIAGASSAATITFQFSGTVTHGAPLGAQPGDQIVGTFSYNTDTAPAFTYKGFADYQIPSPHVFSATVGSHIIAASNLSASVWNHYKGNVEDMVMISGG